MSMVQKRNSMVKRCVAYFATKSFHEIPGPKSYPILGTLFNYLPLIGKYRFDALHLNGRKKFMEFGPVVREEIIPGTNVVWIFRPEDVQELFRKEGRYPQRRSHLAVDHYRKTKPEVYNTGGLLPTNGEEWYKLRRTFQKGLSSPQTVKTYLPVTNEVIDEFIEFIAERSFYLEDFLPYLSRVFLEMLGLVAFDRRLDSFSPEQMKSDSISSRLMAAAMAINSSILKTDNGIQLWRYFDTPMYRKISKAHAFLDSVAVSLIEEKRKKPKKEGEEKSVLDKFLSEDDIDLKDVIGMSADMLLAGIDTTTFTAGFVLYHLARNPKKQQRLYEESKSLLPECKTDVTADILNRSQYLKAAIKESYRLNPISVGIGRILAEDAVFSNYHVPKGNVVVTQNQVSCRFDDHFKEPELFEPERWLKTNRDEAINPYLVLPFGHGPRTCIARRLAEQNIQTLIFKLCRRFEIKWNGEAIDVKTHLINKPDGQLLFDFIPRP